MKLKAHERVGILGITGAGKSHYTAHDIIAQAERVVVWDPHGEYSDPDEYGKATKLRRCDVSGFAELVDEPGARLGVVPEWNDPEELCAEFEAFAACCKLSEGGFTLVIDEVGLLEGRAARMLVMLATQARHWDVPLVLVAQAAVLVPKMARRQLSRIVSFRQSEPDDIAALAERIGKTKADRIARLQRRECVHWDEAEAFKPERATRSRGE